MDPEDIAASLNGDGPQEMFEQLVRLIRAAGGSPAVERWLTGRLTVPDIIELQTLVAVSEPDYVWGERNLGTHLFSGLVNPTPEAYGLVQGTNDILAEGLVSKEAKRAVSLMYLRGFEADEISTVLVLPIERVRFHLDTQANRERNRNIVNVFLVSGNVSEAARANGVSRNAVYETLDRAGLDPRDVPTDTTKHDRAVKLRQAGHSYEQIRNATGLSTNQLRKLFQRAAAAGRLTNYGKAEAA